MPDDEIIKKVLERCPRSIDKRNGCGHWAVTWEEGSEKRWEFQMRPTPLTLKDIGKNCRVTCKRRAHALSVNPNGLLSDSLL